MDDLTRIPPQKNEKNIDFSNFSLVREVSDTYEIVVFLTNFIFFGKAR